MEWHLDDDDDAGSLSQAVGVIRPEVVDDGRTDPRRKNENDFPLLPFPSFYSSPPSSPPPGFFFLLSVIRGRGRRKKPNTHTHTALLPPLLSFCVLTALAAAAAVSYPLPPVGTPFGQEIIH